VVVALQREVLCDLTMNNIYESKNILDPDNKCNFFKERLTYIVCYFPTKENYNKL
jgi:hypothetical protein